MNDFFQIIEIVLLVYVPNVLDGVSMASQLYLKLVQCFSVIGSD